MRQVFSLLLGAFLFNSCQPAQPPQAPVQPPPPPPAEKPAAAAPKPASPANAYLASLQPKLVYFNDAPALPSHFPQARATLFYFSASWCGPCVQFTPKLIAQYEVLKKAGIQVVLVGRDRDKASMLAYMSSHSHPWPGLAPEEQKPFQLGQFASRGIPSTALVDAHGKLISKGIAWDELPKVLELAASGKF
ncbi:MAG: hypothetical protein RL095_2674 [Verrucomicrobiota bacterium]|jgi:nucleoredoxin